jgi:hypothetical protein
MEDAVSSPSPTSGHVGVFHNLIHACGQGVIRRRGIGCAETRGSLACAPIFWRCTTVHMLHHLGSQQRFRKHGQQQQQQQ